MLRFLLATLAAVAVVLCSPSAAGAQALDESQPADGAVLAEPPEQLVFTFDEPIGTQNRVSAACNSNPYVVPAAVVSADALTLTATLESPMPQGNCVVEYTVTGPDGEGGTQGRISFSIRSSPVTTPGVTVDPTATTTPPTTAPAADDSDDDSSPSPQYDTASATDGSTWLGRLLSTLGLSVLFGALVLIVAAWPEGPEYILAVRFLRSVWILAVLGTVLYVVALSAAIKGESLANGLNPSSWLDLLDAGWPGRAALARLVLVVLSGWVVLRPERVIDPTTQLPAIALPTLAVAAVGLSRTGGDLAVLGVAAGILHVLAMAVWLGAVVLLARVVLAGPGDEDLVHAVRGFGRISGPAIVVTVLTGLVQMYRIVGGGLFSTGHGRLLLVKVVAVALMLFIGMTTRQVANHRLARASDLAPSSADSLRRAFGTEALIGIVVLGLSAGLLSFTPAKASVAQLDTFAVERRVVDPTSGIELVVALEPGTVGTNRLRVEVTSPPSGLAGLEVVLIPPVGSGGNEIVQSIPLSGAGVADSGEGGGVPLPVAGAWTLQVNATSATGPLNASQSFDVRNADGTLSTSDIGTVAPAPLATPAPTTVVPSTSTPG